MNRLPTYLRPLSLALLLALAAGPSVASDLAMYLALDGTTVDSTGSGNHGVNSAAKVVRGAVGAAYRFDGTSTFITFPDLGFFNGEDNWTIEFWFKANDITQTATLIDLHGEAKVLVDLVAGELRGRAKVGNVWRDLATTIQKGTWYHLRYSYDTVLGTVLEIDGEEVASDPAVGAIPAEEDEGDNRLGAYFRNISYFKGVIDEVRIYRW